MKAKTKSLFLLLFTMTCVNTVTKADSIYFSINERFTAGSGAFAPFLSTANQYGRYTFAPNSLTLWGTAHKNTSYAKSFDSGFGMELDANVARRENSRNFNEAYLEGKLYFLNILAGAKREVYGNQDPELSSGGMLWSQNSRPIPRVAIQTNQYLDVPFTKKWVAFQGGVSQGWISNGGEIDHFLLHHKYLNFLIGKSYPLQLNYGIQHVVQWGGHSTRYGDMPASLENYNRIFWGKSGNSTASSSDQINTLGNHIISQNLGLEFIQENFKVSLYWQNLTEDPPVNFITNTPNVEDGLWGISLRIPKFKPLHSFLFEYLSTTDQSGPWHDLDGVIFGGQDSYYGNIYGGWTNRGLTIANPWITSPRYNTNGNTTISNNMLRLFYFSGKGNFKLLNYRISTAYSENFGTAKPSYNNCKRQFSYQLEGSFPLKVLNNTMISLAFSGDKGGVYGNNFATILGVSYTGICGF